MAKSMEAVLEALEKIKYVNLISLYNTFEILLLVILILKFFIASIGLIACYPRYLESQSQDPQLVQGQLLYT